MRKKVLKKYSSKKKYVFAEKKYQAKKSMIWQPCSIFLYNLHEKDTLRIKNKLISNASHFRNI